MTISKSTAKTKQARAVGGAGLDSGIHTERYYNTTSQTQKEAAITTLRAGVETLYRIEARKRPLFEIAEGIDTTIGCVFYRRECRALDRKVPQHWRVDEYGWEPRARLSSASRLRIAAEMDRLIDAAEAAGLDKFVIDHELKAPIIAADDARTAMREKGGGANERAPDPAHWRNASPATQSGQRGIRAAPRRCRIACFPVRSKRQANQKEPARRHPMARTIDG